MNLGFAVAAAIIGIIINIVLSKILPARLSNQPKDSILWEVGKMFKHHDETMVSSSAMIAVAVFLSVIATQYLQTASETVPVLVPVARFIKGPTPPPLPTHVVLPPPTLS